MRLFVKYSDVFSVGYYPIHVGSESRSLKSQDPTNIIFFFSIDYKIYLRILVLHTGIGTTAVETNHIHHTNHNITVPTASASSHSKHPSQQHNRIQH